MIFTAVCISLAPQYSHSAADQISPFSSSGIDKSSVRSRIVPRFRSLAVHHHDEVATMSVHLSAACIFVHRTA